MSKPIVAIVGRPNVGKSTLFNALAGENISIVKDTPGVTRDRIYADVTWLNYSFTMVDTGGIEPESRDVIISQMREQAQIAIDTADVIIFMVDVRQGLQDSDAKVADMLRRSAKPVILAVNKVDNFEKFLMDTYEFYKPEKASNALNRLLSTFNRKMDDELLAAAEERGYKLQYIVTIASLIEKETDGTDHGKIASVIYNRLKKDWPLQIDSTTLYEYPDHEGAPTAEMLAKDSPYNTRISKGLPPSPICSPGITSIRAALQPSSTNYMSYALNTATGQHEFFTSADAFNAFVATQNYER